VVLSLRFYMLATMGFGIVGAPVTWLGLASRSATLLASILTALIVGFAGSWALRALGRQTLSSGASRGELVGQVGRVLLACEPDRRGKVRLQVRGQTLDFLATTDVARLEPGATIIVQEVGADALVVCEAPRELSSDWQARDDA
jgi:membrane protein implicated in regulation of membrane protease activity